MICLKQKYLLIITLIFITNFKWVSGQKIIESESLFSNNTPLRIQLNYSNKQLNLKTNDSTFIETQLVYFDKDKKEKLMYLSEPEGIFEETIVFSHL